MKKADIITQINEQKAELDKWLTLGNRRPMTIPPAEKLEAMSTKMLKKLRGYLDLIIKSEVVECQRVRDLLPEAVWRKYKVLALGTATMRENVLMESAFSRLGKACFSRRMRLGE